MANSPSSSSSRVTTTTVSYFHPTTTAVAQASPNILGTRILSIDIPKNEELEVQQDTLDDESFLVKIRDVIQANGQAAPSERFDSLTIGPTGSLSEASENEVFEALAGISPKHFEVFDGFHEYCDLQFLSKVKDSWTELESMKVAAVDPTVSKDGDFPDILFSRITYLDLQYPCSVCDFTGLTNLKKLRIHINSVMDSFINIFDKNPTITKVLETLDLSSPKPHDLSHQYAMNDFRNRLKRCNRLRELKLRMNTSYDTGFATCIPPFVERLEFCGSTSPRMLRDLGNWIHSGKQPTWLPRLKFICIRFNTELNEFYPYDKLERQPPPVEMAKLEKQRDILYRVLEAREPPVLTLI